MSAKLWWQPTGSTRVYSLDLGRPFSQVDEFDLVDESVSQSISGQRTRVVFSTTRAVDYTAELLDDYRVVRKLESLQQHLRSGGLVSVAEDGARTLAAFADGVPNGTELDWFVNLFPYGTEANGFAPVAGDVLVLRGPGPQMLLEEAEVVSSVLTTEVELLHNTIGAWDEQAWCLVRNKGFWPVLRLRRGVTRILETDRRINWRLHLQLEEPPHAFDALALNPGDSQTPDDAEHGGIDDQIDQVGEWIPPIGGPWVGGTTGLPDLGLGSVLGTRW